MQKKIIWFMCGLPGSGKSAAMARYFQSYEKIVVDDYPNELRFQVALINRLADVNSLVVDGTFFSKEGRLQTINNILTHTSQDTQYEINFCVIECGIDECISRNHKRQRNNNKIVNDNDIIFAANNFTDPITDNLPYSNIIYLDQYGNLTKIVQGEPFK